MNRYVRLYEKEVPPNYGLDLDRYYKVPSFWSEVYDSEVDYMMTGDEILDLLINWWQKLKSETPEQIQELIKDSVKPTKVFKNKRLPKEFGRPEELELALN